MKQPFVLEIRVLKVNLCFYLAYMFRSTYAMHIYDARVHKWYCTQSVVICMCTSVTCVQISSCSQLKAVAMCSLPFPPLTEDTRGSEARLRLLKTRKYGVILLKLPLRVIVIKCLLHKSSSWQLGSATAEDSCAALWFCMCHALQYRLQLQSSVLFFFSSVTLHHLAPEMFGEGDTV